MTNLRFHVWEEYAIVRVGRLVVLCSPRKVGLSAGRSPGFMRQFSCRTGDIFAPMAVSPITDRQPVIQSMTSWRQERLNTYT